MTYGAQIFNTSGVVMIDTENPSYVRHSGGVLSSWRGTHEGAFLFDLQRAVQNPDPILDGGAFPPNPNPRIMEQTDAAFIQNNFGVFFVRVPVGHWFWFGGELGAKEGIEFFGIYSSLASLDFAYAKPRSLFPAPGGYGMALFNAAGQCTWDAESALSYIAAGTSGLTDGAILTHPAGAEWIAMPNFFGAQYVPGSYSNGESTSARMAIRRLSATQIQMFRRVEYRVGNNAATYAPPITSPVFVGKF